MTLGDKIDIALSVRDRQEALANRMMELRKEIIRLDKVIEKGFGGHNFDPQYLKCLICGMDQCDFEMTYKICLGSVHEPLYFDI